VNKTPPTAKQKSQRALWRLLPFLVFAIAPFCFSTCSVIFGRTPGGGSGRYGFGRSVERVRDPEQFWMLVGFWFFVSAVLVVVGFRRYAKYLQRPDRKNA
jgi:hypothetical protein